MTQSIKGAPAVVSWMLRDGRHYTQMREFGDEMCRRIVAAGIPLWRGFCSVSTLHPEVAATAYVWRRDEHGATRRVAPHGLFEKPEFAQSPIAEVRRTGGTIRRRLADSDCPLDYPVLAQLKSEGGTDYLASPMVCSSGEINVITWLTDRAGGFSDDEVLGLGEIANALAIIVELQSTRRVARSLLDTYVGHRTGERVLSGAITRGSGETIRAVIWFCDLRGFTRLADALPRGQLIDLLNDYFEIVAGAVTSERGEVLNFIGDGMLSDFRDRRRRQSGGTLRSRLASRAHSGRGGRRTQPGTQGGGRSGDPLRNRAAPGRSHLRQYRRKGPARLHRDRPGRQSCRATREARRGLGTRCGYFGKFRRRRDSSSATKPWISQAAGRHRTAGSILFLLAGTVAKRFYTCASPTPP